MDISKIITILRREVKKMSKPVVGDSTMQNNPFKVLMSCIISLRTKDAVTAVVSRQLFDVADNPKKLSRLSVKKIEKLIYPCGFYKTKARQMKEISKQLVKEHDSEVPDEIEDLLRFKGVGRKTANLVVMVGYGKPGLCVDTHVHRISNRLGFVRTRTPNETESALRIRLDQKYWSSYSHLLVTWGQNVCTPVSPWCSRCQISDYCRRIKVQKRR